MADDPQLPFLAAPHKPEVRVSVAGAEVLASGTAVMEAKHSFKINLLDLQYVIKFDDSEKEQKIHVRKVAEKSLEITLAKFDNALGTSAHYLDVGTMMGQKLRLSVYVEAVGSSQVKVLSYTLFWGGDLG